MLLSIPVPRLSLYVEEITGDRKRWTSTQQICRWLDVPHSSDTAVNVEHWRYVKNASNFQFCVTTLLSLV